jgi:phosphoglycerate dehydrogenase-like enzyme
MIVLNTAPFDPDYLHQVEVEIGQVIQGKPEEEDLLDVPSFRELIDKTSPGVLIVEINEVPGEVFASARSLKVIAVCRNGTNNVDVEAATQQGIIVINAPGRNSTAVAELTIASMIAIARNVVKGANLISDHKWEDMVKTCYAFEGIELGNRIAGIIGLGHIGRKVAKRLRGFDMRLIGYDPFVTKSIFTECGVESTSLEKLMTEADFILLLAAVTEDNKGFINAELLSLMKPSAYFFNMARSVLVDEEALLQALASKAIRGAALDVHSEEPLPLDSPWLSLDNVLLTPHLGGATAEIILNHSKMIYADLIRIKNGKCPKRIVNPDAWDNFRLK